MSAQDAQKLTEKDWLFRKPILKKYWLDDDKKLLGKDGLIEIMKTKHYFSAS